jgi:glutamate carboxypeptidase
MFNDDLNLPDRLTFLKQLVETESPSNEKSAVDQVGKLVVKECQRLRAHIKIHPQISTGDQVEARFLPSPSFSHNASNVTPILLLCHMDTVFPIGSLEKMPFVKKDGKVFGPGVSDMKGGIFVALSAISSTLEMGTLAHPVIALFTSDEEIGSNTSRFLIEKLATESALVIVLEPGLVDGSLKTWRKGVGEYTIHVKGRAAHAGADHQKGCNAIEEIAHQVLAIQSMTDYSKGTTLNTGVIQGGIASNVVPDEAYIEVDLRVLQPSEAIRIDTAIRQLQPILDGTSLGVNGGLNRPPMPFDDRMKATFEKIKAIAAEVNIELKASGTGGASDANFVAPLGIPVIDGLGPAGGEYHSEREFIFEKSLSERVLLLSAILHAW